MTEREQIMRETQEAMNVWYRRDQERKLTNFHRQNAYIQKGQTSVNNTS